MKFRRMPDGSFKCISPPAKIPTFRRGEHGCINVCGTNRVFVDTLKIASVSNKKQLQFTMRNRFDRLYQLHFDLVARHGQLTLSEHVPMPSAGPDFDALYDELSTRDAGMYSNFMHKLRAQISDYIRLNAEDHGLGVSA